MDQEMMIGDWLKFQDMGGKLYDPPSAKKFNLNSLDEKINKLTTEKKKFNTAYTISAASRFNGFSNSYEVIYPAQKSEQGMAREPTYCRESGEKH